MQKTKSRNLIIALLLLCLCCAYFYLKWNTVHDKTFIIENQRDWTETYHSEKDPLGNIIIELKGKVECDIELTLKEKRLDSLASYERTFLIKKEDINGWSGRNDWYSPDVIIQVKSSGCIITKLEVLVDML